MLNISKKTIDYKGIESKLYALNSLSNPKAARQIARWLIVLMALVMAALFLPWQQNVFGSGKVTALTPKDRPQEIHTAIAGRIKEWRIVEGQFVVRGDTLVVLEETKAEYSDPNLLLRLYEQLQAKQSVIAATQDKTSALEGQVEALRIGMGLSLKKAQNKYKQAIFKILSDSTDWEVAKVNDQIAVTQFERYDKLHEQGLISRADWEKRQLKLQETHSKRISEESKFLVSRNELLNAQIELNSIRAEYADKIAKAESDRSSAMGYLADAQGEFSQLKNKYKNMEMRSSQYFVLAPQNGYIVKALKSGIGENTKENEALVTIMPANAHIAAEVYVKAMDLPLLERGRKVRLEFDGWPALQFAGWQKISLGTFGGVVTVIDQIQSKGGKFRVLIAQDREDEPWPEQIRVGSGVYGRIMLNDVPIWYELWRQLNGFPPNLYVDDPSEETGGKSQIESGEKTKK